MVSGETVTGGETVTDRIKTALRRAAVQAEHWPAGYGEYWGKTLDGEWTERPSQVAEYG